MKKPDVDNLSRQAEFAALVERVLEHPLYEQTMARMREDVIAKIVASEPDQDALRFRLARLLEYLDRFNEILRGGVASGRIAAAQLEDITGK